MIMIIQPQEFIPFLQNMPINDLLIPLTLGAGLLETWGTKRKFWVPQHTLLLIFILFVFISNLFNGYLENGSEQIILFLKRAAVYLMVFLVLNSTTRIKTTLWLLILFSTILAIEGIDHFQSGVGWAGEPFSEGRISWIGDWDGSNGLALLFIIASTFALEFCLAHYSSGMERFFSAITVLLLVIGIVLTNSRGGWLSLSLVVFLFFIERYRRYAFRVSICVVLMAGLLFAFAPSRMSQVNTKESSARERLWSWEQGLGFLKENPLFGIGKGRFGSVTEEGLIAHNNYVQISSEVGWIGFFVWLAIPYLSLKGCYRVYRQEAKTREQAMLVSLARAMFIALIGFSSATFFITMELDILFVLWGCAAAIIVEGLKQFPENPFSLTMKDCRSIVCGGAGILGIIYLVAVLELF